MRTNPEVAGSIVLGHHCKPAPSDLLQRFHYISRDYTICGLKSTTGNFEKFRYLDNWQKRHSVHRSPRQSLATARGRTGAVTVPPCCCLIIRLPPAFGGVLTYLQANNVPLQVMAAHCFYAVPNPCTPLRW